MSLPILREIRVALGHLNPSEVEALADRPLTLGVLALDEAFFARVISFLIPDWISKAKARQAGKSILRLASEEDFDRSDLGLCEPGLPHPSHFYPFEPHDPLAAVESILDDHEDLWIPLARQLPAFRDPVVARIIWKISKENALFTVATAIPNVVPSWISVPWALGEFASDTAFLTMNQVRMAFLVAAASDHNIGYRRQRSQIASIIAAAFGWRSLAREMVSKIPAGGGLVSKGLISLAGTFVVGKGLDTFMRLGRGLTREEKQRIYDQAVERGRAVVERMTQGVTRKVSAVRSV